jgi:predicted porin
MRLRMETRAARAVNRGWIIAAFTGAMLVSLSAVGQQKSGPGITDEDSLTFHGITLYGVIDLGLQYETHGAPLSDFRPSGSGDIVQKNSRQSVFGVTPSNEGQSRVGLQGDEPLQVGDWSAVFRLETSFNPQSGELANSLKSITLNNGRTTANSSVDYDGSSAGQAFQTAFAGLSSKTFGTVTFGRQLTILTEGTVKYDPQQDANAFGLIGASGTYQGGGTTEDKRLDSMVKYNAVFGDLLHVGALYKFNGSNGSSNTAVQAVVGAHYAGASLDAIYSKVNDAISASTLTAAQVATLPNLGYAASNSVAATVSDNTTYALMGLYTWNALKFYTGYEHIKFANPTHPLSAGFVDIGGYILAVVNNKAYTEEKNLQMYWAGVRYGVLPNLDLVGAYYGSHQGAYGTTAATVGCQTKASATCSGSLQAFSFQADYHFTKRFDGYAGAMYSGVHNGLANGYTYQTTNIDPTVGIRFKF